VKKYPRIAAPEVVPGKIYLVPHRNADGHSWRPATVGCTEEPGWLRGFCDIILNRNSVSSIGGYASVRFIDDGTSVNIPVCRQITYRGDSPWVFATGVNSYEPVTLREMPETWLDEKINVLVKQIDELEDQHRKLLSMKARIEAHT
jgi:hypothetical protein